MSLGFSSAAPRAAREAKSEERHCRGCGDHFRSAVGTFEVVDDLAAVLGGDVEQAIGGHTGEGKTHLALGKGAEVATAQV